ncbi:MAG TPA: 4-(cytidine 5'-diphospho)-2-C-methyl-D-erythritol kinase, partial [Hellea balneolensis]|nr:4-(cytidine 5'-diphospho)-2-C-methyl-D-erythritol kinase [Hellea balneolensis]
MIRAPHVQSEPARAKINLTLHVGARTARGYHPLQSLVVFADIADQITVQPGLKTTLSISGPFAKDLHADADNLVLKAAKLCQKTGMFSLEKNLPVASGIGGGSADAAAVLRLLKY